MARPRPAPTAEPWIAATIGVSTENSRTAWSYKAFTPAIPEATLSVGEAKSAPPEKVRPSLCSTMARTSFEASAASMASASSDMNSTETKLWGGRSRVTTATCPSIATFTWSP